MASTSLGKIKVQGRSFDHWLKDDGTFYAEFNEHLNVESKTLAGLKDALKRRLATKPLNIDIVLVDSNYSEDAPDLKFGTIISKHSGNDNWIVRWKGQNSTEQLRRWDGKILRADTDTTELLALAQKVREARDAYDKFVQDHKADLDADLDSAQS